MEKGVRAKFVQHPELRKSFWKRVIKSLEKPTPAIHLGIGTGMSSEKAKSPSKWRGQNKLGKLLMEIRESLRVQGSLSEG
jgi:predicted NAD-dependent protein-ADP-ribosyltransferase YbiA (DUF1768 family)